MTFYGKLRQKEDVVRLAAELAEDSTVRELYLGSNSIGDAGAASLAAAVEKNGTLQRLYLSVNSIGAAGAASLAAAVEKNGTLQTLDLGFNSMGDAGAASLRAIEFKLARNKAAPPQASGSHTHA